jgi:hypothetical protein
MLKKTLLCAALVLGSIGGLAPLAAQAQYNVVITTPPPTPVREYAPPPRRGWVWAPGHHVWRGDRYAWERGHWMRERPGYEWREARWVQRDGQWVMIGGDWARRGYAYNDRRGDEWRHDRDGRDDRYGRRNGPYGDRDGDGVPNYRDARPDNPYRN